MSSWSIFDGFLPGTAGSDVCEANYALTNWIAEFFNTVSNIPFFVLPPLLAYLNWQYAVRVTKASNVVWAILCIIGAGSVYFHATLSFVGQLLDELAINWVLVACVVLWYPEQQLPERFRNKRRIFNSVVLGAGLFMSLLAFWQPQFNALFLVALGIPVAYTVIVEVNRYSKCLRLKSLGVQMFVYWVLGLTCWLSDKFQCHHWQSIDFPYLHCMWHVFICLAGCITVVICIFFDSMAVISEQKPVIKFWPKDNWQYLGVPYVGFKPGPFV
ncbi:alkaline ceramidase 2-like [Lineus longissimus]|uniref:alkaline ceramidase 2-like n=1 Tax=Lineus longissimus TaxID=88925 RepID=UPI00315C7CFD